MMEIVHHFSRKKLIIIDLQNLVLPLTYGMFRLFR